MNIMKYLITLILLVAFTGVQAQNKTISLAKKSLTKEEISKIPVEFLDTIYAVKNDGTMQMEIQLVKDLDTAYVENPDTGELNMFVRRRKSTPILPKSPKLKTGDTAYVEDPVTKEIHMIISK